MGAPPESDREDLLGFDCLHRVAQSYLGPLWLAADARGEERPLRLVRRLELPDGEAPEALGPVAAAGRRALELAHPNVLRLLEVLERDELLLVYEHVEAEPLRSLQSWANLRGLSFPVGVALRIVVDLLRGLSAAHELGNSAPEAPVAGGLSPDSVLIGRGGATQLGDAIVAAAAARLEGIGFNTAKLAYAAPEQVQAEGTVTTTSDVFSCAAMLWELLASRRLLAGSRPAIERKLLDHTLPGLRASLRGKEPVTDELVDVVERCLSPDPAARPAGAAELAAALTECGHELATEEEVAAFVGKLSGPRFERRMAAVRARAPLPAEPSRGPVELPPRPVMSASPARTEPLPTSEIETPRAADVAPAPGKKDVAPAPDPDKDVAPAPDKDVAPAPVNAAAGAPEEAPRGGAEAAEPAPFVPAAAGQALFAPAPVAPPSSGLPAFEPLGTRTLLGIGAAAGDDALAAVEPAAPSGALPPDEAAAAQDAPSWAEATPTVPPSWAEPASSSPPASAEPAPDERPPPFAHLVPRGSRPPSSSEPGTQSWFELAAAARSPSGRRLGPQRVWLALGAVAVAAAGGWFVLGRDPGPDAASDRESPAQGEAPADNGAQPAAVDAPPPLPDAQAAVDAGARAEEPAPAEASPPAAQAADFATAKLDDSQLVVLFELEARSTLPSCAERLGESIERYSGNDTRRSRGQIKAARQRLARGDALAAHELACRAVAHNPQYAPAQQLLAELALELGDPAQAQAAVGKALARAPRDKELLALRGDVLALMGDLAGSRSLWLRAGPARGSQATRTKRLVSAARKLGERALRASRFAEAALQHRRAVILTHGGITPSLGLAEALIGLEQPRAALVWAERAAQILPKDAHAQLMLGDALHASGRSDEATAAWKAALDAQPRSRAAAQRLRDGKP